VCRHADPGRFRLLVAAESAGALTAAEMGHTGLPWRADVHDEVLLDLLGPPQPVGPPRRLAELAAEVNEAFGTHGLHPDSPAEVLRAFARAGVDIPNTRAWILRTGGPSRGAPAAGNTRSSPASGPPTAAPGGRRGCGGRFHPEYVAGGVVSGRWATRGGGALQVPKVVRRAVVADDGWRFVVADAGQLEPRVLAAVSGDARLATAAAAGDLYAALAADAFGGDRARAKVALLGAMYGQTGGAAIPALAVLRQNYPVAFEYVEAAAPHRRGRRPGAVLARSHLPAGVHGVARGRPRTTRGAGISGAGVRAGAGPVHPQFRHPGDRRRVGAGAVGDAAYRARGTKAELVFFVHDEVVVHCPASRPRPWSPRCATARPRRDGCCSERPRSGSRSTCRWWSATPTRRSSPVVGRVPGATRCA
jgi:DNA polymerase-1